ncbi:hypothetical protein HY229_01450 [Candidatus Acetothermia bacterium]|nr:hypothetical protein [Candidatus Acetothermia bacterium]MBI3642755.1 hypothetical protein [Candidatus Acetothermia bacterium]
MKLFVMIGAGLVVLFALILISQTSLTTPVEAKNDLSSAKQSAVPAPATAMDAAHAQETVKEIHIKIGDFYFEGPEGRSGSDGKPSTEPDDVKNPKVILRLKNGEHVRLIFENKGQFHIDHEVVSPLFAAPDEKTFAVPPGQNVEFDFTPKFKTVDDGGTLVFDLSCHVRHRQTTDHYILGMHALIEVVPAGN